MSMQSMGSILREMRLEISEEEKQKLDWALQEQFGFIGFDYCSALDDAYETDPEGVKDFILKTLNKRKKRKLIYANQRTKSK